MRALDKIRKYIVEKKSSGSFAPGDRLPSYHEFMKIGNSSYATVLTAMKHLQREGLLEVRNGAGSYLSGGKIVRVFVLHNPQVLPEEILRHLLEKHLRKTELNLSLEFCPLKRLSDQEKYQQFIREEQLAVVLSGQGQSVLPKANLSGFDDYESVDGIYPGGDIFSLPFLFSLSGLVMNRPLVRKVSFDPERIDSTFSWWDEFVKKCRKHRIFPASMNWNERSGGNFGQCLSLFLSLFHAAEKAPFPADFRFESESGHRFLRILRDQHYYNMNRRNGSFFCNEACMNFYTGTWISVQNGSPNRPDIYLDGVEPVPIIRNGRKIILRDCYFLSAYFGKQASVEERNRVWELMKLMSGHDFQLDFCNLSGMVSVRNDIGKNDYAWNRNGAWNHFFPEKKDSVVYETEIFPEKTLTALTLLLEDYLFYGADETTTLRRMDMKTTGGEVAFELKTGITRGEAES